jgi:hypothetical protein
MATRFYYSMRYPPQWPLSPVHISTSWDAGTWSYEGGIWVHYPRILTYGDFGRITTAKIPFGPDDPEHNQYNQREIYGQQGPNFAQGWYPCPNGPTCDPPFKVYTAQFFSDPLRAQTINGNVLGQMLCTECFEDREGWWPLCGAASDSCRSIVIRVFSGDFAVERGVLLEHFPAEMVSEFIEGSWEWDDETQQNGSYKPKQNRNFPPSSAITEVVCEDGDIIVVEIGFKTFGDLDPGLTEWLNHQVKFSFYHNSETDLPVDETTTTELDAWVELDTDIVFQHPAKPFALSNYMVTEGVGYCKYRSYVGFCETEIRAPGIYGQPVVGVDDKSGYGLIDLSFLDGDAPLYMISVFPLNILPQSEVSAVEAPVVAPGWVGSGGFEFGGEGGFGSALPPADDLVPEGGFKFCGPGASGHAATAYPPKDELKAQGGFKLGGAGIWGQIKPSDIPATVLVGSGGFIFSGSGFQTTTPPPPATVIIGSGGFKFGGFRPDPVEVTYPNSLNKVIPESAAAFEMGGEGIWGNTTPPVTVIVSAGAIFALGGAGLATTKFPPIAVITGDALGGFVLAGATPAEVFEAWVLSGQAFEPSVFSGFNFNSFAVHRGQAYAAGEDGIYLLGADTDAGETIHAGARIGPVNFGADRDKRIRGIQYGQGGKNTRIRVKSENGDVGVFEPDRDENRVVVSRDIQGREFTIDIMDFEELSHFEMTALRLARR